MSKKLTKPCPPNRAISEDRYPVFRFIEGDDVAEIDFMNHVERGKPFKEEARCSAMAISFCEDEKAVIQKRNDYKGFRDKKAVAGHITKESGVHTIHKGHINHWVNEGVNMMKVFLGEVKV